MEFGVYFEDHYAQTAGDDGSPLALKPMDSQPKPEKESTKMVTCDHKKI